MWATIHDSFDLHHEGAEGFIDKLGGKLFKERPQDIVRMYKVHVKNDSSEP